MANQEDKGIDEIIWSRKLVPLYELIAKCPLPIFVKSANKRSGNESSGYIEADEVYRIKRMMRIQKITAQTLPSDTVDLATPTGVHLKISIPKDYRGPFQILPYEKEMCSDVSMEDIVKYRPRYIKVAERVTNITGGLKIDLIRGDELEVLGVTLRSTRTGLKQFPRLRKNYRNFVLNPDCKGKFYVIEDDTHYNLAEIRERFPLPQKVSLVRAERHSEVLLKMLPLRGQTLTNFLLMSESQDEYIIGEDIHGRNGIVINPDADLNFYIPDSDMSTNTDENQEISISKTRKKSVQDIDQILIDQIICKVEEKLVLCKPIEQIFMNLQLPPRSSFDEEKSTQIHTSEIEGEYGNIELKLKTSMRDRQKGVSHDPPPIPPKPSAGMDGKHNVKLLTREETRRMFHVDAHNTNSEDADSESHCISVESKDYLIDNGDEGDIDKIYDSISEEDDDKQYELENSDSNSDSYEPIDQSSINEEETTKPTYARLTTLQNLSDQEQDKETPVIHTAFSWDNQDFDQKNPAGLPPRPSEKHSQSNLQVGRKVDPKYQSLPASLAKVPEVDNKFLSSSPSSGGIPEPPRRRSFLSRSASNVDGQFLFGSKTRWNSTEKEMPSDQTPSPTSREAQSTFHGDIDPERPPQTSEKHSQSNVGYLSKVPEVDDKFILSSPDTGGKPEPPPRKSSLSHSARNVGKEIPSNETPLHTSEGAQTPFLGDIDHDEPHIYEAPDMMALPKPEEKQEVTKMLPACLEDLKSCSNDQVLEVLEALNIRSDVREQFRRDNIDGEVFCALDIDILQEDYQLKKFHALRIMKFIQRLQANN